jgi:hypothetical protein
MIVQARKKTDGPLPGYDDAISRIKDYAWEGFKLHQAGTLEEFEKLWGVAFDELLNIGENEQAPV